MKTHQKDNQDDQAKDTHVQKRGSTAHILSTFRGLKSTTSIQT